MQTSGIKIDLNSKKILLENSEKIQKVIKFAVKKYGSCKVTKITTKACSQAESFIYYLLSITLCAT
jgi:hypothetical protein